MRDLIIVGNGGHAKVVIDILEERGDYNILGIITKNKGDEIDFLCYKEVFHLQKN